MASGASAEVYWIDKTEVARRQVCQAVRLFFEERDVVAIHTIIASAHQILVDISDKRGTTGAVKNPSALHNVAFEDYLKQINYPFNFLKHADRDPDGKINIAPLLRFSGDFILDAILMLQQIAGEIPIEAKVFWAWFVSKYPKDFDNLPDDSEIRRMQQQKLAEWDFPRISKFLEFAEIIKDVNS